MAVGAPAEHLTDERTIMAVGLANAVLTDPTGIHESTWVELKELFTEPELVELVFVITHYIGAHLFGYLLDIEPYSSTN